MKPIIGAALLIASVVTIDGFVRVPIKQRFRNQRRFALRTGNEALTYLSGNLIGSVSIGTPEQKFQILFDIGSSDMFIISKYCNQSDFGCKLNTRNHKAPPYDHKASSTYQSNGHPVHLQYDSIEFVDGTESIDSVKIGGLEIKNQTFVEALSFIFLPATFLPVSGMIGLGWRKEEKEDAAMPLENIFKQHKLPRMFSVYLTRGPSGLKGGELIIGGIDNTLVDNSTIKYAPVKPNHWRVTLDSVTINGVNLATRIDANIVISSQKIHAPSEMVTKFNKIIGAHLDNEVYSVDCSTYKLLPPLHFKIGEFEETLGPEDYILEVYDACFSLVNPLPKDKEPQAWILGDAFLGKFYQVYDYENARFGIGTLKK